MQETILITGGSGLVGSQLTKLFLSKNFRVRHLSRRASENDFTTSFKWDLENNSWDPKAIEGVSFIIHLAGANVAGSRWTAQRKREILESRTRGSKLIAKMVDSSNGEIKGVISASAVGYYGSANTSSSAIETDKAGNDFLAKVCVQWENEITNCKTSVAIMRTGVVLAKEGGAVPKMVAPIKLGLGSPLGTGTQPMPWIHINDLCNMYLYAIQKGLNGVYNAVAPETVNNKELTYKLAKTVNRKIILPNVPSFVLKLMLGEMSSMLLTGVEVSSQKIKDKGFEFEYPSLSSALSQILK